MNRLCITLLGAFRVTLDGEILTTFGTDKARALLAYLAVESHRPHRREYLAGLLWSDQPEKKALHSLRQSLSTLRKILKDGQNQSPFLLVTRETIQFNIENDYWLDVNDFQSSIAMGFPQRQPYKTRNRPNIRRLKYALKLYQGNFIDQLTLKGSPAFDEWAILQRETLNRQFVDTMCLLVDYHESRGEFEQACEIAEQIVEFLPWEEKAHQIIMRMLAQSKRWSAAEMQFQALQRYLGEELGVEPSSATLSLLDNIRKCANQNIPLPSLASTIQNNLPQQPTVFVGREKELDDLSALLTNPRCQLITLSGSGGIGKTRLALRLAREQIGIFTDGVFFVPLISISSSDLITNSIAAAIGFSFYNQDDPLKLLIDYLQHKEILLVLDNFEHFLVDSSKASEVITKILQHAPSVVIIATSRQPLNLLIEHNFDVQGFPFPTLDQINTHNTLSKTSAFDALELFKQVAKRISPKFSLETQLEHVTRVCQLVDGIPLGIELAATWVRSYTLLDIANQIEQDLDFLKTSMQDIPDRHRSLRSVFNQSWNLLSEGEKSIFRKLSVFCGGFSLDAAKRISGASASHIQTLLNKSLLQNVAQNRYDMHNLLRQFAFEKLQINTREKQITFEAHSNYFSSLIQAYEPSLFGSNPVAAQKAIGVEIDNIRLGWHWSSEQKKISVITQAARGLGRFYDMRSWFAEGQAAFAKTALRLKEDPNIDSQTRRVLGIVTTQQAWFDIQLGNYQSAVLSLEEIVPDLRTSSTSAELSTILNILGSAVFELGKLDTAKGHFEESLREATELDCLSDMAFANNYLGSIARNQGDFSEAQRYYSQSLEQYKIIEDIWGSAKVLNNLGTMSGISGNYAEAEQYFDESLSIRKRLDDQAGIAGCLQNLSIIAFLEQDYSKTKQLREECLSICQEIGFTWGIASTLKHLGDVNKATGNLDQANQNYSDSLEMNEKVGDRRSAAYTLNSLGGLAILQGKYSQSIEYYTKAFYIAEDIKVVPLIIDILMGISELWIKERKFEDAYKLLAFAQSHPGAEKQTLDRGKQLETLIETQLSTSQIENIKAQNTSKSLLELTEDLIILQ